MLDSACRTYRFVPRDGGDANVGSEVGGGSGTGRVDGGGGAGGVTGTGGLTNNGGNPGGAGTGGPGTGGAGIGGTTGTGGVVGVGGATGAGGASSTGGATGTGGAMQCGGLGQPCCSGLCQANTTCDGTICIAANVWAATPDSSNSGLSDIYDFNGGTWLSQTVPGTTIQRVRGLWGVGQSLVIAVGDQGEILRRDNTGAWHKDRGISTDTPFFAVTGAAANDVWAVGDNRVSHYDGATWTDSSAPQALYPLYAVWMSARGEGWAVGEQGTIAQLTSGSWIDKGNKGAGYAYFGVWGSGPSDVYAVGHRPGSGSSSLLFVSHFNGNAWSDITSSLDPQGTVPSLYAIWGSDSSHVWAVGDGTVNGGTMLFWNGSTWAPKATGASGPFESSVAIWGSGPNDLWVIGINVYHYNGSSWTRLTGPVSGGFETTPLSPIWFSGS
jgi:photosystem II stability/assembly factor-like uncharacterized protein